MSSDIVQKIDRENVLHMLVLNCAPLLAGLKIAAVFTTHYNKYEDVVRALSGTNIEVLTLAYVGEKIALLLFDRTKLERYLNIPANADFMRELGYGTCDTDEILREFVRRYRQYQNGEADFPHEMGIILGYPLEDVYGFMQNDGQNYIMSGYWKVYCKPQEASRIFREYDETTERMMERVLSA